MKRIYLTRAWSYQLFFFLALFILNTGLHLLPTLAVAQNSELIGVQRQIEEQFRTVNGASQTFEQTLKPDATKPFLTTITVKESDKKGKTTLFEYRFNLADVDPASIQYETRKDLMVISLRIRQQQSFITVRESDQSQNNVARIQLYAPDVDKARSIVELFKKLIPAAEKSFHADSRLPATYEALLAFVKLNLDEETTGSTTYHQTLDRLPDNPLIVVFTHVESAKGGKSEERVYQFNLADINPDRISLDSKGKTILLSLESRDKFIRMKKDGQWVGNVSSVDIDCKTAYKARLLQLAWKKWLPMAKANIAEQEARFVKYSSPTEGLQRLAAAIKPTAEEEQRLEPTCKTTFVRRDKGGKGKEEQYQFHWSDLDARSAWIQSKGSQFILEITTSDKGKWITYLQNGERGNYMNSLEVVSADLEAIRYVPALLAKIIPGCKATLSELLPPGGVEWIASKISAGTDPSTSGRTLSKGSNACEWIYKVRQESKKTTEIQYDLKLADLDPNSVRLAIAGKEMTVDLTTVNKEKNIKTLKDGQPSNYVGQIGFLFTELSDARATVEVFRQAIGGCKKR